MELFDIIFMKTENKCPRCDTILSSNWQTTQVVKRDVEFKEGEKMKVDIGEIIIDEDKLVLQLR